MTNGHFYILYARNFYMSIVFRKFLIINSQLSILKVRAG